ncbi:uncharacterized protein IL334_001476 [Kwoniella shivajii]|uniref:Transglycosylase SLT domain-containing protein n=1 Tax=Kwoniella shivajii TaxID=564305 RepID=A0ABZ1CT62_9TREE|nr:hypothetical protein IL334_001476 [Kwoniella shivajii]
MLPSAFTLIAAFLPLLALTSASSHAPHPPHVRHRRIGNVVRHIRDGETVPRAAAAPRDNAGHAEAKRIIKKSVKKRGQKCRPRQAASSSLAPASSSASASASAVTATSTTAASQPDNNQAWGHLPSSQGGDDWTATSANSVTTTSTSSWAAASTSASNSGGSGGGSTSNYGILSMTDGTCGYSNADGSAPNGAEGWLNCGVDGGGWTPPMVTAEQLIAAELSADGIFAPCGPYIDKFNQYAAQYGIKGIMLASFAMQESTCNPAATGGNGEAGLMQLASVNCGGAPGGNCYDIDFNIQRAAELFTNLIDANGGNVLLAIGSYNGWSKGLTVGAATAAAGEGRCAAQNNLDYIHQYCNGWMQGKSGYELGTYFNLKHC